MSSPFKSNAERRAKNAEDYPSIFGKVNLTSIRENVGEILKLIGREGIFREYTLHDSNHIDAVLALVDKLIPADTAAKMRTADWLMIVLACYFHDLGMLVTKREFENRDTCPEFIAFRAGLLLEDKGADYKEAIDKLKPEEREEFLYQEFVRKHHAKRISLWIQGQHAYQYGDAAAAVEAVDSLVADLEQVVRDDLAKICLSHHEDDLFDLEKYQVNRVYGDNPEGEANLHYAALILRSADILQIQKKRVPPVLYKLIDPSNPKSQEEWARQAGVRAVKPKTLTGGGESDTIEVHASFDKESAYFGLLAYLQLFAGKELERCHDWAKQAEKKGATFRFPWRQIDSSQVEPRGFEGRSYSFTLDQERILKLLTGHTLYNDSRVAIREVLQNALDAVRFRNHLFPEEPMGKIEVIWDSTARTLTIRDTGTGMTQETIEKFLLNVGSSFYQSETVLQQHAGFSPISRFGIGVLSTFMIADEVRILTVHPDDEFARRLTLPSVVKSYLIKKLSKDDPVLRPIGPHGTEVVLQVRRSAEVEEVEGLVRYWLVLPRCDVTCKTDAAGPVRIGFTAAKDVIEHYYTREEQKGAWRVAFDVRGSSEPGIDIAYVVEKPDFADVWDFSMVAERREHEVDDFLLWPPGMCVEGVRVRSAPAGYERWQRAPWAFVNLTGRDAPRTNVARSDIEQTPEFESALLRIYSMLGSHVQHEFDRLLASGSGLVEAAWEADFILRYGLGAGQVINTRKFREAMASLRVLAFEDKGACRAVTKSELESLEVVWTVDSRLIRNIEGVSGALGLDLPAEVIVQKLGKSLKPAMPPVRLLGSSTAPLRDLEVSSIRIYPEERGQRIDISWERKKKGRWIVLRHDLRRHLSRYVEPTGRQEYESILVARDERISSECSTYDVVIWRNCCLILATSVVPDLFDVFGMTEQFAQWLGILLHRGRIPKESQPFLKEQLVAAKGEEGEELLNRLTLPFERRFGDYRRSIRGSHLLGYDGQTFGD
jgi:hypothetical protein